ncbi:MAG: HEAT repeat domain-containing protein [Planctomycetota bacterium]
MWGSCILIPILLWSTPQASQEARPKEEGPKVLTTEEAQKLLDELRDDLASEDRSARLLALDKLAKVSHPLVTKALVKQLAHRQDIIRSEAARALGAQTDNAAREALVKALKHPQNRESSMVLESLVEALGRTGYPATAYSELANLFNEADPGVRKAVAVAFGLQKEVRAFGILIEWIDEPIPKDPHAPENPPASWWRLRWQTWQTIRFAVQDALKAITGKTFKTREEALIWAATPEAKKRKIELK